MSDGGGVDGPRIRGGGGIGHGPWGGTAPARTGTLPRLAAALRRRWVSGVAVVTVRDGDGRFRGVSVSSVVVVSVEPPIVAVALSVQGSVHQLLNPGTTFAVNVLDRSQTFLAERFAGRAPLPDAAFTGVPHRVHPSGLPVIDDAIGWCVATVTQAIPAGDHVLVLGEIRDGAIAEDTDDPLVSYEGRFRSIEAE